MEQPQTDVIKVANYSMRAKLMGHDKEGTVCQSLAMDASPHGSISACCPDGQEVSSAGFESNRRWSITTWTRIYRTMVTVDVIVSRCGLAVRR